MHGVVAPWCYVPTPCNMPFKGWIAKQACLLCAQNTRYAAKPRVLVLALQNWKAKAVSLALVHQPYFIGQFFLFKFKRNPTQFLSSTICLIWNHIQRDYKLELKSNKVKQLKIQLNNNQMIKSFGFLPCSNTFNVPSRTWPCFDQKGSLSLTNETFHSSSPKECISLCLLTRNNIPSLPCNSKAPNVKTLLIMNGPDHLDLSFPGKSFNLKLNKRTCFAVLNSHLKIWLPCPFLRLFLV